MTNETTQAEDNDPTNTGSSSTPPLPETGPDSGSSSGSKDPTGVEGANPALDDTGNLKAQEVGEAPEPPENPENLDLTPQGLSDEPAKQEDKDSLAKPDNS
ncbi:hypothetical protein [Arthrobacter sp. HMWF013]|uniref:hypothetical protein n=1 Tax=Arthrobacter sp. HMWF013 TaxID=2056849 RepID=UPI000D38633A|nr:hypothetical protein [Arthrobacter sp. HMWF013]PTT70446.1 hypothetical protein DBR22_01085 [Arthrobacter sp. HMWF013]